MHQTITTQDDVRSLQFILGDVQNSELPDVIAIFSLVHPNDVWNNISPDISLKFKLHFLPVEFPARGIEC